MTVLRSLFFIAALLAAPSLCGAPKNINPAVTKILNAISEERIATILIKLESFGTRHILSDPATEGRGIGAARQWIFNELKSYSPRLQVRFDSYKVKKQARIAADVELVNVVAVLPGTTYPERQFIISGHYDSLNLLRRPDDVAQPDTDGADAENRPPDPEAATRPAPGVTDDGSGVAATMELARVMSQHDFEKTIVFIAFAGEEVGLVGSALYAEKARQQNQIIDAVLNNDIIGSDRAGNGFVDNGRVRVFSEEPNDSLSRQVARYVKEVGERYLPAMKVDLIFRSDRFARGGDHTPFNQQGYAAVRFTSAEENYANQHTATDTFANTSVSYIARVAKINCAALATLALAPQAPVIERKIETGPRKGQFTPTISRGKSHYDAQLRWKNDRSEPDLEGYAIVVRPTTSPYWDREIFVGKVTEFTLENFSIDDVVLGVKAIDHDGNESLVSAYVYTTRPMRKIETY